MSPVRKAKQPYRFATCRKRHNSRESGFTDVQGILEEGSRRGTHEVGGPATGPVRLVHGVGPTGPVGAA